MLLISLFNLQHGSRERSLSLKHLQKVKALLWRGLLQVVGFFSGLSTPPTQEKCISQAETVLE